MFVKHKRLEELQSSTRTVEPMPPKLATENQEADVLAFLATTLKTS